MAANGLGQETIDAAAFYLLRDQADADEDGNEKPEDRRGGQTEILDDLQVLPRGELTNQIGRPNEEHGKKHQVVEHLGAYRVFEHMDGDQEDDVHG